MTFSDRATAPTQKPRKARRVKATPVKAPAGDIASSGGNYGRPEANRAKATNRKVQADTKAVYRSQPVARRKQIVRNATGSTGATVRADHAQRVARNQQLATSAAGKDTKGDADRSQAAAFLVAHPEILHPDKPQKHGSLLATITAGADLAKKVAPIAAVAPYGAAKGIDKISGSNIARFMADTATNTPKDAAELVTTTPTSLVKLGDTAVHHPEKVPGMLAQPYKDLAKDPMGTIRTHPVSTFLMLDPAIKLPGKTLGKVARVAGKQTLKGADATLPGTALREARPRSRSVVKNARQARADAKNPNPQMSTPEVQRRVDEFHDFAKQKAQQITAAAHRTAAEQAKALPKDQRAAHIQANVDGARAGAQRTIDQRFVKEFGSTWQRHPSGTIVKPKAATEGHLHAIRADADAVAAAITRNPKISWEPQVMAAGNRFGVVPKDAKLRLNRQRAVGTSPATMAKVMRRSRGALTQAVLPLSTKWLMGQGVEAGVRSVVAGAGPADLLRFRHVVKKMNAARAGSGDELLMRVSGGQFGLTGTAREFAQGQRSLADEFAGTSLERVGNAATRVGNVLPAKAVRKGWNGYTRVVLDSINGALEGTARKAMAGQAIKNTFMDTHVMTGLSDRAIGDAAKGLTGTESQVALGRAVDRMYGQYQKFSPDKRSLLLHWTPFLPWYLNTAKFLFKVLPGDHPLKAALVADVNVATEQWRKDHGLSLRGGATKPAWELGTYPTKAGLIPVGKFTPFGVGTDVPGAVASLTLPQLLGPIKNSGGVDWKWQELMNGGSHGTPFTPSQKALRAIVTGIESQVPGVTQAGRLTGLERKYVDRKPATSSSKTTIGRLLNPLAPIPNTKDDTSSSRGGKAALPPGVSQAELDQLIRDAQRAAGSQPQISQAEINALLAAPRP